MATKKCLVTGGAGFIGSNLVGALLDKGWEVIAYDNLSTGSTKFLEDFMNDDRFKFIKGDILDAENMCKALDGVDVVFHLAANPDVRLGAKNPKVDLEQGIIGTHRVLEAMRTAGVGEIVFSSSSTVYGEARVIPTPEDYGPLIPISMYGAAKLAAEALISAYAHTFGFRVWIFRFANIIGRHGTHGVIVDFIRKLRANKSELEILGDGRQRKSYLLVDDCVEGMLYGYEKSKESVNIYNLGSGDYVDVITIANIVCEEMGLSDVKYRFTGGDRGWKGDIPVMLLDISKIKKLGWKPKFNSADAVRIATRILLEEGV
ncbi:MAG: UDP-glucose 4-epimerase [Thermoplasmata archaeon]|nr:MAG: UDP-glucose 4-epimerase [Thermoplasmata archaeon]